MRAVKRIIADSRAMTLPAKRVKAAVDALSGGDPVLVFDGDDREGEIDMIHAAEHVTPERIARLRNDAGGLICTAISADAADRLGIPFYTDVIDHPAVEDSAQAYGDRSSFGLWVNHADTYTGITDNDRATTIQGIADAVAEDGYTADMFADAFTTPGHVAILRAADGLLAERQGHTEIGVYLARKAYCTPAAVVCEMLDDETGDALAKDDAKAYADDHGFVFLTADDVLQDFQELDETVGLSPDL
jgi:3,4-dihydroxy 2-butanone 4-phosphate synthase